MDDKSKQPKPVSADTPQPESNPANPAVVPAKKRSKKGLIWGIVGGSIGLIVVIVGIVLAVVFLGPPSKEDYKQALESINKFTSENDYKKEYAKFMKAMDSGKTEELQKIVDESIEKTDTFFNELGSEKAMRDKEVKDAYDKYKNKWEKLKPNLEGLVGIAKEQKSFTAAAQICGSSYFRVRFKVQKVEDYATVFDTEMANCKKAYEKLKESDSQGVSKYAEGYLKYMEDLKEYNIDRLKNGTSSKAEPPKSPQMIEQDDSNPEKDLKDLLKKKSSE